MAPVCSVYFRGLVYLCLICSGSKNDKLDVTLRSIGHHTLNKVCVIQTAADLVPTLRCDCESWHTSAGDQKTDAKSNPGPDNCVKIRSPGRNTLSPTLYGSLDSYFSHFITPDVHFSSTVCWDRLNSLWLVVSRKATSAGVSPEKKKRKVLGKRKVGNYSDLLLFVVTITKGLCLSADIQTEAYLFSCQKLLIAPCSYNSLLACVCGIWTWLLCKQFPV